MKWTVGCGVPAVVTAASAVMAGDPGKEPSGGSTPAEKAPTVNCMMASPRAYLAGGARDRTIDYAAVTGAAESFARAALPALVQMPVGTREVSLDPRGIYVLPIDEGIGN